MATNQENDYNIDFPVPQNYNEPGRVFNGMFKTRNLVEAAVLLVAVGYPEFTFIHTTVWVKIVIIFVSVLPPVIIALVGIDNYSLVQYLGNLFKFIRNKRKLHFRRIGYEFETQKVQK